MRSIAAAILLTSTAFAQRPLYQPDDAINTPEAQLLGSQLAHDTRLSATNTHSCMTCHRPEHGYSDGRQVSQGATGFTSRNAPTLINASSKGLQFHDGRATFLEGQATQPLVSQIEMGQTNINAVVRRVNAIPGYRASFQQVFGGPATEARIGKAIAAFERTLVSSDAPIDRAVEWSTDASGRNYYTVKPAAAWVFTEDERHGFELFFGRAGCVQCHQGPDYRTEEFVNNGMGFYRGFTGDRGRRDIVRGFPNRSFAVPTLRELQRTAPYGHAGQLRDLRSVVAHYSSPAADPARDARVQPLNLTSDEQNALVAFLSTAFAGANYPVVVAPDLPPDPPGGVFAQEQQQNRVRRGLLGRRR